MAPTQRQQQPDKVSMVNQGKRRGVVELAASGGESTPLSRSLLSCCLLIIVQLIQTSLALENGLARTPPMGWLAWERFTCQIDCVLYPDNCINSRLFEQMAELMEAGNWIKLGYDHVNIDDCWSERQRDNKTQRLVPDASRFKEGIKHVADVIHSHEGLKLGIYGDCGTSTCAGYPAQLKSNYTQEEDDYKTATYFQLDADTLAEWQVDSLKFDGCFVDPIRAERICPNMAKALAETGRPIMLVCEWPFYMMYAHADVDFQLAGDSCNVWRYYDDIEDSWLSILNTVDYTVRHQSTIVKYHGPGHWFDPDQLVIGNFGLSVGQARAQMALWCVWAAPLYMSNDLREIRPEFVEILQNEKLIAVDQDKLGVFGQMVSEQQNGLIQAFVKPMLPVKNKCPSFAVVILNKATLGNKQKVSFKLAELVLAAPIRQAALNQVRVVEYDEKQREKNELSGASAELDPLLDEQQQQPQQQQPIEEMIDSAECRQRLESALKTASDLLAENYSPDNSVEVHYKVFDLFAKSDEPMKQLSLRDSLDLFVEPSSVRALKLIEK